MITMFMAMLFREHVRILLLRLVMNVLDEFGFRVIAWFFGVVVNGNRDWNNFSGSESGFRKAYCNFDLFGAEESRVFAGVADHWVEGFGNGVQVDDRDYRENSLRLHIQPPWPIQFHMHRVPHITMTTLETWRTIER